MRNILTALLLISSSFYAFSEDIQGLHCGTRGNFWGTIASDHVIPDYFPPENPSLRAFLVNPFLVDLSICEEEFAPVHLGRSCMMHDACYGTLGETKDGCDMNLLYDWQDSCAARYNMSDENGAMCKDTCHQVVEFMYDAMRFDFLGFCPSCIAFEHSQKNARREIQ